MYAAKRLALLLLAYLYASPAGAQAVNTLATQKKVEECFFVYEVKVIDEFIERFNDEKSSYIRQQCKSMFGSDSVVNRPGLLKSLFNKDQAWGAERAAFIGEVTNAARPQFLSFTDSNWYAVATCFFMVNGKKVAVPVILHMHTTNGASKWMIAGLGNSELFNGAKASPGAGTNAASGDFIPTSSHGTDFVVFNRVFGKQMTAGDYFEPALLKTARAQQFIGLIKQGKATYKHTKGIKYQFFGINNWVFTVTQFKKKDANTGWLISSLQKTPNKDKGAMLAKLLYP